MYSTKNNDKPDAIPATTAVEELIWSRAFVILSMDGRRRFEWNHISSTSEWRPQSKSKTESRWWIHSRFALIIQEDVPSLSEQAGFQIQLWTFYRIQGNYGSAGLLRDRDFVSHFMDTTTTWLYGLWNCNHCVDCNERPAERGWICNGLWRCEESTTILLPLLSCSIHAQNAKSSTRSSFFPCWAMFLP